MEKETLAQRECRILGIKYKPEYEGGNELLKQLESIKTDPNLTALQKRQIFYHWPIKINRVSSRVDGEET